MFIGRMLGRREAEDLGDISGDLIVIGLVDIATQVEPILEETLKLRDSAVAMDAPLRRTGTLGLDHLVQHGVAALEALVEVLEVTRVRDVNGGHEPHVHARVVGEDHVGSLEGAANF